MADKKGPLEVYGPEYPSTRDRFYSHITGGTDLQKYPLAALGAYGFPRKNIKSLYEEGTLGMYTPSDDRVYLSEGSDIGTGLHELRHRAIERTPEMSFLNLATPAYRGEEWQVRLFDALAPNAGSAGRAEGFLNTPEAVGIFRADQSDERQLSTLMLLQAIADAKNVAAGNPRSYNQYPDDIYEKVRGLTGLELGPSQSGERVR